MLPIKELACLVDHSALIALCMENENTVLLFVLGNRDDDSVFIGPKY
jgi:hypothetical protein